MKQIKKVIGNVIFVEFKNPDFLLTKGELDVISKRIDQIEAALDLCGDNDDDVRQNLDIELEMHERDLKRSFESAKKREKKTKKTRQTT